MILFTDKEFDQDLKSVDLEGIIWKRPHDIVNEPVFIVFTMVNFVFILLLTIKNVK